MPIEDVNGRIDKCLRENSKYEHALWAALLLTLAVGLSVLLYAALHLSRMLMGLAAGDAGLAYWPTNKLIQLHRRKLALSVVPAITSLLSRRDAAREIHSLVARLLD